jgi:hypothetical protein
MVQASDNLSRITGTIRSRRPHPTLEGYDLVDLALERSEAAEGKADLLASQRGRNIELAVRRELLGAAGPGATLECRAKRTPAGAMCEARPKPGDFGITAEGD